MFWKILILILRCKKEDYVRAVRLGGDIYTITLSKFVPVQEELRKWMEAFDAADEDIKDNFHLNCEAKLPESTKPETYVTERVVNISDLEKYIEQAHLSTVSLICGIREGKILSTSDVEDGLEKIDEVLKKAYHFDFCVERRSTKVVGS